MTRSVDFQDAVQRRLVIEFDKRPGKLRLIGCIRLEQRLVDRRLCRIGRGRTEMRHYLRRNTPNAMIGLLQRLNGNGNAILVVEPRKLQ